MARAATKKDSPAGVVGKAELAAAIGWTRPRLDRRLDQDPKFPVKKRGTRAGGWEFDIAAVAAYLAGGAPAAKAKAKAKEKPQQAGAEPAAEVLPYEGVPDAPGISHRGESTASQRLKNAQAAKVEDSLRKDRRELIEAEEMRIVLGTMLARLGKGLDSLSDMVTKRLGLPEESSDVVRAMVDELRQNMVTDLKALLAKPQ